MKKVLSTKQKVFLERIGGKIKSLRENFPKCKNTKEMNRLCKLILVLREAFDKLAFSNRP